MVVVPERDRKERHIVDSPTVNLGLPAIDGLSTANETDLSFLLVRKSKFHWLQLNCRIFSLKRGML